MDIYIHKIIQHFTDRLAGIIKFKGLVKSVKLDAWEVKCYGKMYYRAIFDISLDETSIENLSIEQIKELDYHFADNAHISGVAFVSYITEFSQQNNKQNEKQYLKRLKEFDDSYTLLGSFVTSLLAAIAPEIMVYSNSLDKYPQFNYVRKFYREKSFTIDDYKYFYRSDFYNDVRDYSEFYNLTRKIDKEKFLRGKITITDEEISQKVWTDKETIRTFAIACKVPFIVIGGKTIESFCFDLPSFKYALQDETNSEHAKHLPKYHLSSFFDKA